MPVFSVPKLYTSPSLTMPRRRSNTTTDKPKDADAPEVQSLAPVDTPSPTVLKAVREYEHTRKFSRKTAEHRERLAHKGHSPLTRVSATCPYCLPSKHNRHIGPKMMFAKGLRLKIDDEAWDGTPDVTEDWVADVESRTEAVEVPLAELLKTGKARKTRQKAGDFEFVPNVRSVIILEESAVSAPDVDEPWEHVDWDEDDPDGSHTDVQALSYAEILANTA